MSNTNSFIPNDYEAPKSGGGFTKLEAGANKFRILSSPLMMWLEWRDGKPIRHPFDPKNPTQKPQKGGGQKDSVKHAWGLIVWNYKTEQIEVFELDKQDVIAGLTAHAQNEKWGHPKAYDVVINKKGSGMETEYNLVCEPHSDPSQAIIDGFTETPIDLNQMLVDNGNPFINNGGATESTKPATTTAKTVTPENYVEGDVIPAGYVLKDGKLVKKTFPF